MSNWNGQDTSFLEYIDDAVEATKEAYASTPDINIKAKLKEAENALYGAAKLGHVVTAARPVDSRAELRRQNASDWRSIAADWESEGRKSRTTAEQIHAELMKRHAQMNAEFNDALADEMERVQ